MHCLFVLGKDMELLLLKKDVQDKLTTLGSVEIKNLPATIKKQVKFHIGSIDIGYIEDNERPLLSKMRFQRYGQNGNDTMIQHSSIDTKDSSSQTDGNRKSRKSRDETDSEEEDDDDEDDDATDSEDESGSETDSEEESESEDERSRKYSVETSDKGIQTEGQTDLRGINKTVIDTRDKQIGTDEIITEEKAVNTRSRSLQSLASKDGSTSGGGGSVDGSDNSLAARRRRRRERAQTTQVSSMDDHDNETYNRRKQRSSALYNNHSVDDGEVFVDADSNNYSSYY